MTTTWDSLYLPSDDQQGVVDRLKENLDALGYNLYDPFGLIPGKSYAQTVRLFVSPPEDHWIRIIGRPDPRMMGAIARPLCLYLRLDGDTAFIETYAMGYPQDLERSLKPYLTSTEEALRQALYEDLPPIKQSKNENILPELPEDIQKLSKNVDPQQAQKMFKRLSSTLTGKINPSGDAELSEQAQALIEGHAPQWASFGGRRIQAVMACLRVPANWHEPDFNALRDAYQLHARRQRKPDARLYPGDEEIMAQVPNALDYVPIYGGCDA